MKNLKILLVSFLGIVVLGYLILFIAIRILFPPERLNEIITPRISKAVGREVKIEGIGISVFPGLSLNVEGVTVVNADGFGDKPLLKVTELDLSVKLFPLFRKRVEVKSIHIEKPEIFIEKSEAGKFNFEKTVEDKTKTSGKAEEPATSPVSLVVSSARIRNGTLIYLDHQEKSAITVSNFDQEISISLDEAMTDIKVEGQIEISELDFRDLRNNESTMNFPFVTVNHNLKIDTQAKNVQVEQLMFIIESTQLNFAGSLKNYDTIPNIDLSLVTNEIEISDLLTVTPPNTSPMLAKLTGVGKINLTMQVKGEISENKVPNLTGEVSFDNLTLGYSGLPSKISKLNGGVEFTDKTIHFINITAKLGNDPFELSGSIIDFDHPKYDLKLNTDLNLTALKDYVELPKGTSITGRLKVNIIANGVVDNPETTKLNGAINMTNGSLMTPELAVPITDIDSKIDLTGRKARISKLTLQAAKSSLAVNGEILDPIDKPKGTLELNSPLLDLDEILSQKETETMPEESIAKTEPIKIPFETLDGKVSIKKLITNQIEMNNVRADVTVRNNILSFKNIRSNVYAGSLTGSAEADFNDPSGLAYTINMSGDSLDVNEFAATTIPIKDVFFGKMQLQISAAGTGLSTEEIKKNITAEGTTVALNGKMTNLPILNSVSNFLDIPSFKEINFRTLHNTFKLQNERLSFERFEMNAFDNALSLDGSIGLDGSLDFSTTLVLSEELTKQFRKKAVKVPKVFLIDSGRLPLDFTIKGTTNNPKLKWDTTKAVGRAADQTFKIGLEKLFGGRKETSEENEISGKQKTEQEASESNETAAETDSIEPGKKAKNEEPLKKALEELFKKKKKKKDKEKGN